MTPARSYRDYLPPRLDANGKPIFPLAFHDRPLREHRK